jgi:DNA-nicking Smr family endonuclease
MSKTGAKPDAEELASGASSMAEMMDGVSPLPDRFKRYLRSSDPNAPLSEPPPPKRAGASSTGATFEVAWDDEFVEVLRDGSPRSLLGRVTAREFEPQATVDLHGMRQDQARQAVTGFVQTSHRRGARHLLVIVGKGTHSEDGVGVLPQAAVQALTEGAAASLVLAAASAHNAHGGSGAIAVFLR